MTAEVGALLRIARLNKSMSLRSVASAIGVSASLISQVETGKTQPSVSTLYALSTYLGLSLDDLLENRSPAVNSSTSASTNPERTNGPMAPVVQHAADNPCLEMDNGVRWERLAVSGSDLVQPLLVTYAPGASSSIEGKLMRHNGFEFAYILEGELTLQLEFVKYSLSAGDSLQFDSNRPHMYANAGNVPARGVWFVVGRHQQNQTLPTATENPPSRTENGGAGLNSAVDVLYAMDRLIS